MASTRKILYVLERLSKRMWFRASLYSALAVATALIGAVIGPMLPTGLAGRIGADSVGNLLAILASSMLAVTTFSLSTMVAAYSAASQSATPRAAKLLIEDDGAQGALATFTGAFLFSIVGLIALSTGIYGDSGRLVLFAATVAMIVLITVTLLRWIEQLSRFGRIGETIMLVERATRAAMRRRAEQPWMGGVPAEDLLPEGMPLDAERVGYVVHIDMAILERNAAARDAHVHVLALPGAFVTTGNPLAIVVGAVDESCIDELRKTFTVEDSRSFEHDPRYGLIVLTEIAARALSPAINDPGTSIQVIGTAVRLLDGWSKARSKQSGHAAVEFPHVFVPILKESDMFDDVFPTIAREGAHMREIGIRLQKALGSLALSAYGPSRDAADVHARLASTRAMDALDFEADREALRDAMQQVALTGERHRKQPC